MATTFNPEFDYTYMLTAGGEITEAHEFYAPDVSLDPGADVAVDTGWSVLSGHTGQYGYQGAVMHPSELWGDWAVSALTEQAQGGSIVFAVVEVRTEDGDYPDGDPVGWAVAYRTLEDN